MTRIRAIHTDWTDCGPWFTVGQRIGTSRARIGRMAGTSLTPEYAQGRVTVFTGAPFSELPAGARSLTMGKFVEFEHPPVVETVASVGFAPIKGWVSADVGDFRRLVSDKFPVVSEHPVYDMPIERLDASPLAGSIELRLGRAPAKTRHWLIAENDQRLIQIQPDWFAVNWRKRAGRYTSYEDGIGAFADAFTDFEKFVSSRFAPIEARQCEITYINNIPVDNGELGRFSSTFDFWRHPSLEGPVGDVESAQFNIAAPVMAGGSVVGRLHVSVAPREIDGSAVWVMNLTVRGRPLGDGLQGILGFLDIGHESIVKSFKSLTTKRMHKVWGLKDGGGKP